MNRKLDELTVVLPSIHSYLVSTSSSDTPSLNQAMLAASSGSLRSANANPPLEMGVLRSERATRKARAAATVARYTSPSLADEVLALAIEG
jgi:hypothetical protein